ncbi:uncharacterized protein LOC113206259 [Frankliniella occidentalis]|uniref:Uncharacterized protein LOC113206259 n=1 Tax=Frankliniella occidentalis TaxID=133901 RepID=A0A9C6XQC3_FRAOC|nr:uncharacterized protein LOC113206259 [Frankliniella occidentalis]
MAPKFAYVTFTDSEWEIVPVSRVFLDKKKTEPFAPSDLNDFNSALLYWVLSYKFTKPNGSPLKCKGYVCRLADSEEDMENSIKAKRPRFLVLCQRDSDIATTTNDERDGSENMNPIKRQQTETNARNSQEAPRIADNVSNSHLLNGSLETESNASVDSLPAETDKARIKSLEAELANLRKQLDQRVAFEARIERIEEAVKVIPSLRDDVRKVGSEVETLKSQMLMRPPAFPPAGSSRSSSTRSEFSAPRTDLGHGISILNSAYSMLDLADNKTAWQKSLVCGVYGQEAKMYCATLHHGQLARSSFLLHSWRLPENYTSNFLIELMFLKTRSSRK